MARIRTIKPKFWDDTKLAKISRDARLTYIGMWNFSDDIGVIVSNSVWLKSKIFPYDEINLSKFENWLRELQKLGMLVPFSTSGNGSGGETYYYLPNLCKHQVINRPNYDDLFVDKKEMEIIIQKLQDESLIDHGLFTDESSQGKDRIGKERKGGEGRPEKHLFQESEIFDKKIFQEKLIETQYESANVDYYHEVIKNWADSKNEEKINWLAAAKNWMASDMKDGKFITKDFKPPDNGAKQFSNNGKSKLATGAGVDTQSAFSKIDKMPG